MSVGVIQYQGAGPGAGAAMQIRQYRCGDAGAAFQVRRYGFPEYSIHIKMGAPHWPQTTRSALF